MRIGKKLVYDLMDRYQNLEGISKFLKGCDYYFKRSFLFEKIK